MKNLQLKDSVDGGSFVFDRNDYILDEGIYSELYCALFSTHSPEWLGDGAFNLNDEKISSRTENAINTYDSNISGDVNLIKKAIKDDLDRFTQKNPNIEIGEIALLVYTKNSLEIRIEINGSNDAYNFIYQKTKESLENIKPQIF